MAGQPWGGFRGLRMNLLRVPAAPAEAAVEAGPKPLASPRPPPTPREAAARLPERVPELGGGRARYRGSGVEWGGGGGGWHKSDRPCARPACATLTVWFPEHGDRPALRVGCTRFSAAPHSFTECAVELLFRLCLALADN